MADIDKLQRFILENAPIRGEYITLTDTFKTIIAQHAYPLIIQRLLGEALCVAALLSAIIKFEGRLTVQFRGSGKLKLLLAQCNNEFHMRGLAKFDADITEQELLDSLREGLLVIMLDAGTTQSRYQGVVAWSGYSLSESIEGYFKNSEQLATKLCISVDDECARGLLFQVVPTGSKNKQDQTLVDDAVRAHWQHVLQTTALLSPEDLAQHSFDRLLEQIYPNEEIRVFPAIPVAFKCTCSRRRGEDAVFILGREEAEAELKNKHSIVVTCDFCNQEYVFDHDDVAHIFEKYQQPPQNTQLH